jgi:hypothetical protein
MASNKKEITRKTTHVQPELNSLLRLGHQVNKVKQDLKSANDGKVALGLAKDKLLDSPNTNKTFRKTVAKRVDFGPEEKLFNQLASLDITETSEVPKKAKKVVQQSHFHKRDPEAKLSDFHQPFQGQPIPSVQDGAILKAKIIEHVYKDSTKKDDTQEDLKMAGAKKKKFQNRFKR